MRSRTRNEYAVALAIALFALCGTGTLAPVQAQENCPNLKPIDTLGGVPIYADKSGGQVNREAERQNQQIYADLDQFLLVQQAAADNGKDVLCATSLGEKWATAGALLAKPRNAQGDVKRVMTTVALNSTALKLQASGAALDRTYIAWLGRLTAEVRNAYDRNSLAGTQFYRNNVYFWSGAAQGLYAALSGDASFRNSSDQVWRDAIEMIGTDGLLVPEIQRRERALIYHQFALSALLELRETREALILPISKTDDAALKRLSSAIGSALCDPSELARKAGAPQEKPGIWGARVMRAMGNDLSIEAWQTCGAWPPDTIDTSLGGDVAKLKSALDRISPKSPDRASRP